MYTLYLDNVRGFCNTFIQYSLVNFFVGENSTGKSSVMHVNEILNSSLLWRNLSFNIYDQEFGVFDDIVSIASKNKQYFDIGYMAHTIPQKPIFDWSKFCLMRFINKDGVPTINRVSIYHNGFLYKFVVANGRYGYLKVKLRREKDRKLELLELHNTIDDSVKFDDNLVFEQSELFRSGFGYGFNDYIRSVISGDIGMRYPLRFGGASLVTMSPIRTRPKRIYELGAAQFSPEGDHTPYLIRNIRDDKSKKTMLDIINDFGVKSGLFKLVYTKSFGRAGNAPFELIVKLENKPIKIVGVGYGVSQILPIVVEILHRNKYTVFSIQQPEVHLHPRAQAAFGEFVYDRALIDEKKFFIETHSDYIIDRFRFKIKNEKFLDSKIIYFERQAGKNKAYSIQIKDDGSLSGESVKYRGFFLKERSILLGL